MPLAPPQQVHSAHIWKLPSLLLLSFITIIIFSIFPSSIKGTISASVPFASKSRNKHSIHKIPTKNYDQSDKKTKGICEIKVVFLTERTLTWATLASLYLTILAKKSSNMRENVTP
jgi:hypothetical protein